MWLCSVQFVKKIELKRHDLFRCVSKLENAGKHSEKQVRQHCRRCMKEKKRTPAENCEKLLAAVEAAL